MAGVRSNPHPKNGKYQGWYVDAHGIQHFVTGTTNKKETLYMARRLEDKHRLVRLDVVAASKPHEKPIDFEETVAAYLSWGRLHGGHKKRPWSDEHLRKRTWFLKFWGKKLSLRLVNDLADSLPVVEAVLKELQDKKLTGKTLQAYADGIAAFCDWCVDRCFLAVDPLKSLEAFDKTPATQRRSLTVTELQTLFEKCYPKRRMTYETAALSGLRAGELRSLTVSHLDAKGCGLVLDPAWTKNRKQGFQPLPRWLVDKLAAAAVGKPVTAKLLYVPLHLHRPFDNDLKRAGISKTDAAGNKELDFHALRVAYDNLVIEKGASVKEAQEMMRHSNPRLTMNTYGRARKDRLSELAEAVGNPFQEPEHVTGMFRPAAGAESVDVNAANAAASKIEKKNSPGVRIPPGTFYSESQPLLFAITWCALAFTAPSDVFG